MSDERCLPVDPTAATLPQFLKYFLKLGFIGFGGPVALVGYMNRDLVERRGWVTEDTYRLLLQIFLFFLKSSLFVFGSGLAIVPFLYKGVVQQHGCLNERQFLDAVAVAMITPGPVVITVAFIGYIVAGFSGATVAALAVFLPVYLLTVLPAPWFKRNRDNPQLRAFVQGATAAATGALSGAVLALARRALIDLPTLAICLVSLGLLLRFKLPESLVVLLSGAAGLGIWVFVG